MRRRREDLERAGARALAVGFSPADALAALATYLEWPWPFLSDPERLTYRRLAVGRASLLRTYSSGTLRRYAGALRRGVRLRPPVEDTRQLGADAVVVGGRAVRLFLPRSPDDRTPVSVLVDAVLAEAAGGRAPSS